MFDRGRHWVGMVTAASLNTNDGCGRVGVLLARSAVAWAAAVLCLRVCEVPSGTTAAGQVPALHTASKQPRGTVPSAASCRGTDAMITVVHVSGVTNSPLTRWML
jgi:hypothetical protein